MAGGFTGYCKRISGIDASEVTSWSERGEGASSCPTIDILAVLRRKWALRGISPKDGGRLAAEGAQPAAGSLFSSAG